MEASSTKQVITLRNLPSNLVEEAIVVLKANKKAKKIEYTKKASQEEKKEPEDFYIMKEAEMVIQEYLKEMEEKNEKVFPKQMKMEKKYQRLQKINIALFLFSVITTVSHFLF